jgi:hypothetical protein
MAKGVGGARWALVALLLTGSGAAHAIDPQAALDALGFSATPDAGRELAALERVRTRSAPSRLALVSL